MQDESGVDVVFADGSTGRYDLVIGSDGVRSWTRQAVGIDLETTPTGMGIWRVFAPRPASVTRTDLFYGGPSYIAGYCPTGENTLYAYIVEKAQDRFSTTPEEKLDIIRELSQAYHGPWDEIRDSLTDPSRVNYTWFETHVLPAPWNRGRSSSSGTPPMCAHPPWRRAVPRPSKTPSYWPNYSLTGTQWTRTCGRRSWTGGSTGPARWCKRPCSWDNGCSIMSRATSPD